MELLKMKMALFIECLDLDLYGLMDGVWVHASLGR